jgi:hypothetical protein
MKKFRDLKVGDSIAIIRYELSQGDWSLTITETEIVKINKRKKEFELSNRFAHPESLDDTHIVCMSGVIQCPNDERNIDFAQKMLLTGMNMHRQRVYSNLQQFLVSCGAGYNLQGDLIIHR